MRTILRQITTALFTCCLSSIAIAAEVSSVEQPASQQATILKFDHVFQDCDACPSMAAIPSGWFEMGSNSGASDEKPTHRVVVSAFAIGRTEVTWREFEQFVNATDYATEAERDGSCHGIKSADSQHLIDLTWRNPGYHQTPAAPVVCVSFNDAQAYIQWLRRETGKSYRLPSEAEWEYAARAGQTTKRFWGDSAEAACTFANVADHSGRQALNLGGVTHECDDGAAFSAQVASYHSNSFGLFDMLGNVWEWTADCYRENYNGAPRDGEPWTGASCGRRVLRGGSWEDSPRFVRSANRNSAARDFRLNNIGFRVARTL